MKWLNGLKITPERLMDNTADEVITSGLVVPSGWSVSSFQGTRVHGITEVDIFITRTGAAITESSAGSGNISGDPLLCTLPSGWAPPRAVNATWGNGSTDGEATIVTSGEVNLRSISGSGAIATGTNVRVTSMWISETPGGYSHDETTDITTYTEAGLFWVTGAAGDGVSDDGWAIQAQLDAAHAAGGGTVIIPGGKTYGVSTFLVVYDNTTVWAYGATIKAIGNSGLLRNFLGSETFAGYSGHSHIQILGGTWDANAADAGVGTVTATTNCMGFIHCEDITVRDATITNVSSAHGLEFNSTSRGRAINCRFLGYKDNSGDGSRDFSEAIQIDMAVSGSAAIGLFDNTPSKDILIQGCQVGASSRLGSFGRGFGSPPPEPGRPRATPSTAGTSASSATRSRAPKTHPGSGSSAPRAAPTTRSRSPATACWGSTRTSPTGSMWSTARGRTSRATRSPARSPRASSASTRTARTSAPTRSGTPAPTGST